MDARQEKLTAHARRFTGDFDGVKIVVREKLTLDDIDYQTVAVELRDAYRDEYREQHKMGKNDPVEIHPIHTTRMSVFARWVCQTVSVAGEADFNLPDLFDTGEKKYAAYWQWCMLPSPLTDEWDKLITKANTPLVPTKPPKNGKKPTKDTPKS